MDSHPFRILSLCSGVGGIELGFKLAEPTARTICYVEIEAFACEILARRMEEKRLDEAPIWTNLKTFDGKPWRGVVDCITGGYPCQPFSVAGKKLGDKDARHLWPEIKRLITEIEPPICFFENVGGHLRLGFEEVANDLQQLGYKVKAGLFTAAEVGAPHKRERLFILAYRDCIGSSLQSMRDSTGLESESAAEKSGRNKSSQTFENCCSRKLADCQDIICKRCEQQRNKSRQSKKEIGSDNSKLGNPNCTRLERYECQSGCSDELPAWPPSPANYERWNTIQPDLKPAIHAVADGMANRVDEIRACGNGVVPLVAAYAWRTLTNGMYLTKNKLENRERS